MSTIKVQLLGNFRIILNQQDISASFSDRVKLLFAYLLLNPESSISRKQLAFTFWPDTTESQARTNLRNLLHHLRHSLQKADEFFEFNTQNIRRRINASISLDVQDFKKSVSAAEICQSDQERISYLQQAANHYRGGLLPDLYEDWLLKQREELHQLFINALFELGFLLEDDRQYPEAIQVMNRLIRSDPLNELAYQRSMRFHALNNDRTGALKVYHACSTMLRQELAVEPSQDTQAYYEQILQFRNSKAITAKKEQSLDTKKMMGRQREWGHLQGAWQAIIQGKPGVVLILGEAGMGKTRLANEMAQWTRRQGVHTAFAQCYPSEDELPFAPVVSWLRTPEFKKEIVDLEPLWQEELARLLPEYKKSQIEPSQSEIDQKWQRRRLFEAIAKGIIGHRKPRLLILDDAQWCDQDTLDFVHYLLHYDKTVPALVVLTARTEELTSTNPVNQLGVLLQSKGHLLKLELEPLKKEEIQELAADLTNNDLQEEFIDRIYTESEGNPLFVVEMLRSGKNAIPDSLPISIRSLLEYRLSKLSPSASELAGIASAIGREFSYRLLEAACRLDADALVRSLDELWLRRIVENQQGDDYNFTHGKLRNTAYEALTEARRRLNHRRIAEALISNSREESGQTAKHFELAGQHDRAVEQYIEAAEASRRVFSNQVAKAYLERALSLISENVELESESISTVVKIRESIGDIYELTGDRDLALEIYLKALEQVIEGDSLTKARILGKIAKVSAARFGYDNADDKFIRAVDSLGNPPDENDVDWWRAWLDIQFERVWMYYNLADVNEIESTLEPLLPVIERLNAQDKLIAYKFNLVGLHCRRDRYRLDESTKRLSHETLILCKGLNNSEFLIRATTGYGLTNLWCGDLENAKHYLGDGLKLAGQAGDVINQIISLTYLAVTYRLLNDSAISKTYAERALVLCEREDEPTYAASAQANLGWFAWREGNMCQAKELSSNALEGWSEYYPFKWLALWTLIDIYLQEGQFVKAVELIQQVTDSRQQALPEEGENKLTKLVETFEQGNTNQVEELLLQVIGWAKENHYL